jgi:hypothetical protein
MRAFAQFARSQDLPVRHHDDELQLTAIAQVLRAFRR